MYANLLGRPMSHGGDGSQNTRRGQVLGNSPSHGPRAPGAGRGAGQETSVKMRAKKGSVGEVVTQSKTSPKHAKPKPTGSCAPSSPEDTSLIEAVFGLVFFGCYVYQIAAGIKGGLAEYQAHQDPAYGAYKEARSKHYEGYWQKRTDLDNAISEGNIQKAEESAKELAVLKLFEPVYKGPPKKS